MIKFALPDNWPDTPAEAIALQKKMCGQICLKNGFGGINIIAGVDCSYDLDTEISRAVIVLLDYNSGELIESVMAHAPTAFPYVPGLLSFREIPVIIQALNMLSQKPDLLMVDGQGIAHPRRLGIAAHLGILTDLPAIGVAKSLLCGEYPKLKAVKGSVSELTHKNEKIGTVLISKEKCKPLFVSPGHKIDHATAHKIVLKSLQGYRLPEPTRIADKFSKIKPKSVRKGPPWIIRNKGTKDV